MLGSTTDAATNPVAATIAITAIIAFRLLMGIDLYDLKFKRAAAFCSNFYIYKDICAKVHHI
jgi:hypothetical protein